LIFDVIRFRPNWVQPSKEELLAIVEGFMEENKDIGWVMDGNFKNVLGEKVNDQATDIICKLIEIGH
jgi:hypothetical protein